MAEYETMTAEQPELVQAVGVQAPLSTTLAHPVQAKGPPADRATQAAPVADARPRSGIGEILLDSNEVLFRQLNPIWVVKEGPEKGLPNSEMFGPGRSDDGLMSIARSSKTSGEGAYATYTKNPKRRSLGVYGITVGECAALDLNAHDDEIVEGEFPDPAHAVVNFRALTRGKIESKRKILRDRARARGLLYAPPEPSPAAAEPAAP